MERLLVRRRLLGRLARQGSLAHPKTRPMKIQSIREARSEEAVLGAWNNFTSFVSGFHFVGAVLLAPRNLVPCCYWDLDVGLLVVLWTHIIWWIISISILVIFIGDHDILLMVEHMVTLSCLILEWGSFILSSILNIQWIPYEGLYSVF
jgi:hypothetical protein